MFPHELPRPPSRLIGVNIPRWLVAGAAPAHYRGYVTERDLGLLVNWRLLHVRLGVDAALLDEPGGLQAVDDALAACARYGLGTVLALRLPDHPALFATPAAWRPLAERWAALAGRYRGWQGLLHLDLLDTPSPPDDVAPEVLDALGAPRLSAAAAKRVPAPGATAARAWSALAGRLTRAVREVDEQRTLVVQSTGARPETFAQLRLARDPHTVCSFHLFLPEALTLRGEGTYPGLVDGERWDRERLQQALQPALDFRRAYEAPLYLGAFGVSRAAPRTARLTWARSVLSLCRSHGLDWAYWAYRDDRFSLFTEPGVVDYDLLGVLQSE